jgi:hypothetical protein
MKRARAMLPIRVAVAAVVVAAAMATYLVVRQSGGATGAASGPPSGATAPAITVSGNQLLADGRPFVVHGVTIIGFLAPPPRLREKALLAYKHFGRQELLQAKAFGANTIRYTISLGALAPHSTWYDPQYLTALTAAIKMTRSLGMDTILTLSSEQPSAPFHCPLPNQTAESALETLVAHFGHERDVMIELYNEPFMSANRIGWGYWQHGGHLTFLGGETCQAIGMQRLIDTLRAAHSNNVLIVPGLQLQRTLQGVPQLHDPAHGLQIAYGIHVQQYDGPTLWAQQFGALSASAPVIVTEWNPSATSQHCAANSHFDISQASDQLLSFLQAHHIGLVGYAFDSPETLRVGFGSELTSLTGFHCGQPGGGDGELIHRYFTTGHAG